MANAQLRQVELVLQALLQRKAVAEKPDGEVRRPAADLRSAG